MCSREEVEKKEDDDEGGGGRSGMAKAMVVVVVVSYWSRETKERCYPKRSKIGHGERKGDKDISTRPMYVFTYEEDILYLGRE